MGHIVSGIAMNCRTNLYIRYLTSICKIFSTSNLDWLKIMMHPHDFHGLEF
jgi:hypothetical protein